MSLACSQCAWTTTCEPGVAALQSVLDDMTSGRLTLHEDGSRMTQQEIAELMAQAEQSAYVRDELKRRRSPEFHAQRMPLPAIAAVQRDAARNLLCQFHCNRVAS